MTRQVIEVAALTGVSFTVAEELPETWASSTPAELSCHACTLMLAVFRPALICREQDSSQEYNTIGDQHVRNPLNRVLPTCGTVNIGSNMGS